MKKFVAVLGVILLFCCPLTVFTAESDTRTVPYNQGIEVYGSCESNKNYYEIVIGVTDIDTVKLPDGITISVRSDSKEDNGLRIIIIPVTPTEETEAYAWMSNVTKDFGKEPIAYYLAFYRGNNPVQPKGKIIVTETAREGSTLYYMDGSAKPKEISYDAESQNISFEMKSTGYYLSVKTEGYSKPTLNDPREPDSPQTGDDSNVGLWIFLMIVSVASLFSLWKIRKKSRT